MKLPSLVRFFPECPQAEGRRFDPEARARSLKRRNRFGGGFRHWNAGYGCSSGSSTLIEVQAALAIGRPVILCRPKNLGRRIC